MDVYRKTVASDGIAGLYRGFGPSVLGIIVYRGLYFGMYDSIKPILLVGPLEGSFMASFLLGWAVTTGSGIASYPLDTIRRRMMMTSGEVCILRSLPRIKLMRCVGCQVQVLARRRPPDRCFRRHVLVLQGCWCQHSPWCCWCWCPFHLRPGPASPLRQEVQVNNSIWLTGLVVGFHVAYKLDRPAIGAVEYRKALMRMQLCCQNSSVLEHRVDSDVLQVPLVLYLLDFVQLWYCSVLIFQFVP